MSAGKVKKYCHKHGLRGFGECSCEVLRAAYQDGVQDGWNARNKSERQKKRSAK